MNYLVSYEFISGPLLGKTISMFYFGYSSAPQVGDVRALGARSVVKYRSVKAV